MDVFGPLIHLVLRSVVVLFPMTVGWLAFRRLALSTSGNAWVYSAMFLFAAVTSAAVMPWTLGLSAINWVMLILALISPMFWIGVIFLCDTGRTGRYGTDALESGAKFVWHHVSSSAGQQDHAKTPLPMFRHTSEPEAASPETPAGYSTATRTLLALARDIRSNPTSEQRRPRRLPPPEKRELPFLRDAPRA